MVGRIKDYYRRKSEQNAERKNNLSNNWKAKFKDPMTSFTGILAICTLFLVVVGYLQWRTLEKSDETLRAGQRAFIFVKQSFGQWIEATKIDNEIVHSWHIEWENSENSPTKDLIVELFCVRPQQTVVADPIAAYGRPTASSHMLLGPKQITWGGVCNYRASELASVKNGMHLYIGALATYFDIFDIPHITEYCTEIIDLKGTFDDLSLRPDNRLRNCETRNCADKECNSK